MDKKPIIMILSASGMGGSGSATWALTIANNIVATNRYDVILVTAKKGWMNTKAHERILHIAWDVEIPAMYPTTKDELTLLRCGSLEIRRVINGIRKQLNKLVVSFAPVGFVVNHASVIAAACAQVNARLGLPLVLVSHGTDLTLAEQDVTGNNRRVLQSAMHGATHIVLFNESMKARLNQPRIMHSSCRKRSSRKLRMIPTGIDFDALDTFQPVPVPDVEEWRHGEEFLIAVMQLRAEKGVDFIARLARECVKEIPWRIVVCGDGAQRKLLEMRADAYPKRLLVVGHLSHAHIASLLPHAAAGLCLYQGVEAAPLTPIELAAQGVPPLMFYQTGMADFVDSLVRAGFPEAQLLSLPLTTDIDKIVQALRMLIAAIQSDKSFGGRLASTVRKLYDIRLTVDAILELIEGQRKEGLRLLP